MDSAEHVQRVIGTCRDMCPSRERLQRDYENDIHRLELITIDPKEKVPPHERGDYGSGSPEFYRFLQMHMIKKFQRSSADHELRIAECLRTPETLLETVEYIENYIMPLAVDASLISDGVTPMFVYLFVWDRFRMVAKDFTLQQSALSVTDTWVEVHERMARWFVYMDHAMKSEEDFLSGHAQQNGEQLNNLLKTLDGYYRREDLSGLKRSHAAEFIGYFVLFQLGNGGEVTKYLQRLPSHLLETSELRFAVEVWKSLRTRNGLAFFRLLRSANVLQACLLGRYIDDVRFKTLEKFNYYLATPIAGGKRVGHLHIAELKDMFCFDSLSETAGFVTHCGLSIAPTSKGLSQGDPVLVDDIKKWETQVSKAGKSAISAKDRIEKACVMLDGQKLIDYLPRDKNDLPIFPTTRLMGKLLRDKLCRRTCGDMGHSEKCQYSTLEVCRNIVTGAPQRRDELRAKLAERRKRAAEQNAVIPPARPPVGSLPPKQTATLDPNARNEILNKITMSTRNPPSVTVSVEEKLTTEPSSKRDKKRLDATAVTVDTPIMKTPSEATIPISQPKETLNPFSSMEQKPLFTVGKDKKSEKESSQKVPISFDTITTEPINPQASFSLSLKDSKKESSGWPSQTLPVKLQQEVAPPSHLTPPTFQSNPFSSTSVQPPSLDAKNMQTNIRSSQKAPAPISVSNESSLSKSKKVDNEGVQPNLYIPVANLATSQLPPGHPKKDPLPPKTIVPVKKSISTPSTNTSVSSSVPPPKRAISSATVRQQQDKQYSPLVSSLLEGFSALRKRRLQKYVEIWKMFTATQRFVANVSKPSTAKYSLLSKSFDSGRLQSLKKKMLVENVAICSSSIYSSISLPSYHSRGSLLTSSVNSGSSNCDLVSGPRLCNKLAETLRNVMLSKYFKNESVSYDIQKLALKRDLFLQLDITPITLPAVSQSVVNIAFTDVFGIPAVYRAGLDCPVVAAVRGLLMDEVAVASNFSPNLKGLSAMDSSTHSMCTTLRSTISNYVSSAADSPLAGKPFTLLNASLKTPSGMLHMTVTEQIPVSKPQFSSCVNTLLLSSYAIVSDPARGSSNRFQWSLVESSLRRFSVDSPVVILFVLYSRRENPLLSSLRVMPLGESPVLRAEECWTEEERHTIAELLSFMRTHFVKLPDITVLRVDAEPFVEHRDSGDSATTSLLNFSLTAPPVLSAVTKAVSTVLISAASVNIPPEPMAAMSVTGLLRLNLCPQVDYQQLSASIAGGKITPARLFLNCLVAVLSDYESNRIQLDALLCAALSAKTLPLPKHLLRQLAGGLCWPNTLSISDCGVNLMANSLEDVDSIPATRQLVSWLSTEAILSEASIMSRFAVNVDTLVERVKVWDKLLLDIFGEAFEQFNYDSRKTELPQLLSYFQSFKNEFRAHIKNEKVMRRSHLESLTSLCCSMQESLLARRVELLVTLFTRSGRGKWCVYIPQNLLPTKFVSRLLDNNPPILLEPLPLHTDVNVTESPMKRPLQAEVESDPLPKRRAVLASAQSISTKSQNLLNLVRKEIRKGAKF